MEKREANVLPLKHDREERRSSVGMRDTPPILSFPLLSFLFFSSSSSSRHDTRLQEGSYVLGEEYALIHSIPPLS